MDFLKYVSQLTSLFTKKAQQDSSALVKEARELVMSGEASAFTTGKNEKLNRFFNKLSDTPYGAYGEVIRALRVLSDAGCAPALKYRHTVAAERMGYECFEGNAYLSYVIEHSVAYINGNNGVFRHMADYCEGKTIGAAEKAELLKTIDSIRNMEPGYFHQRELNILRDEHPEIPVVLGGDLLVYRAANTADRKLAYAYLSEARENGVSARINMDQAFNTIMARLPGREGP